MSLTLFPNDKYSYMDEESVHPFLKCTLCKKPLVNPVSMQSTKNCCCRPCVVNFFLRRSSTSKGAGNTELNPSASNMETVTPVTETLVLEMLDSLLVRCRQCGQTNIKRGQLEEHEKTICIKATVLCRAADIKCLWRGPRIDQEDHEAVCKFEPLRPAFEYIFNEQHQTESRLENLETQINELANARMLNTLDIHS